MIDIDDLPPFQRRDTGERTLLAEVRLLPVVLLRWL